MITRFLTVYQSAILIVLTSLPTAFCLTGCHGDPPPPVEDPKSLEARVKTAQRLRAYFDKCVGKYDMLSEEDRKAVDKITGSTSESKNAFSRMMAPQGGPSTVGGGMAPPPSGDIPGK